MEHKYFLNRQNATKAPAEEMESIFGCIADHFSYDWIKSNRAHPLQQLWNRKDALSTNELYFFGSCLKSLTEINAKWTKKQVKIIKDQHVNNRNGALFEINGLGILSTPDQKIIPASENNPGFDGTLELAGQQLMRISLKNYNDSSHYKEFSSYGKRIEERIKILLKEKGITSIQIVIDAVHKYPGKSEWDTLFENLPALLEEVKHTKKGVYGIAGFWAVIFGELKDDYQSPHPDYNSYILLILGSFHPNEHINLISKIDEACSNLITHSKTETENIINAVFIHLPESASIIQCEDWVKEDFENNPDKPITAIILYQPTVSSEIEKDNNFIHHCFRFIVRKPQYERWNKTRSQLNFQLPVGIISNDLSISNLIADIDGETSKIEIKSKYIYQKGNLYLKSVKDDKGNVTGNVKRLGSGIFSHSVFDIFPGEPSFTISGHFPPIDKLLIL